MKLKGMKAASQWVWLMLGLALLPGGVEAKPRPPVTASLETASSTVQLGAEVDVTLRLEAIADVPDVTAELLPAPAVQIVSGPVQWSGALNAGDVVALVFRARVVGAGDSTLGARVVSRQGGRTVTGGAVLYLTTTGSAVELSTSDHFTRRLARTVTAQDRAVLGVTTPAAPRPPADEPLVRAVSGTVHGTVRWTDPEGNTHPVRGALVQVVDGAPTGPLLQNTVTGANGEYSASVNATTNQVTVTVFSVDDVHDPATGYGAIVHVYPQDQLSVFYSMSVGPVAMTANLTVDITAPRTQRGTPGHPDPTPNTSVWRAFSVFDAMRTYWYQGTALLGRNMAKTHVAFPSTQCGSASCFRSASTPWQLHIIREDAYDWDVLGHEFVHFLTAEYRAGVPPGRSISEEVFGAHSGGSAIGQAGRNREQGAQLAWSEGFATALALLLQQAPLLTSSPFPTDLLNLSDGKYSDTEDQLLFINDAETPNKPEGYASEHSVLGVLWDLFDTQQDSAGTVTDSFAGANARTLWDALTKFLPCDPCERLDRLWTSILTFLGIPNTLNPVVFEIAKPFVINRVAPRAISPPDGATFNDNDTAPTFRWIRNGDPSPDHGNDRFVLVISRDDFKGHVKVLTPPLGSEQYTPTPGEWNDVRQGGSLTSVYRWFVAGTASSKGDGNPEIPQGIPWFSNPMTFSGQQPPPPEELSPCSIQRGAITDGVGVKDTRTFDLGKTPVMFDFEYNSSGAIADRFVVTHDGATLLDTGCVVTVGSEFKTLGFAGGSTRVKVEVFQNCNTSNPSAQWGYILYCPKP